MDNSSKAYLIGGGIASLSAAVYLIKDGGINPENITIFDESKKVGGSLDAQDLPESEGYTMRGIRMFEEKAYTCTFDLMSLIPSLKEKGKTIRQEFIDFNKTNKSYSKSRILKDGHAINSRPLGLHIKDRLNLFSLLSQREHSLEDMAIWEYFTPAFFTSNFWYEFCTVFAFLPWHSLIEFRRYLIRFIQDIPSIDTLESIESSPYNQYEFLVLPIVDWLKKQGVNFSLETQIINLNFRSKSEKEYVSSIEFVRSGNKGSININADDYVFTTLGSIVANSTTGNMKEPPILNDKEKNASWALWEKISENRPDFGKPSVFNTHIDESKWISFTITFRDSTFFDLIEKFIDKNVNTYGGVSLIESNWLMSIVLSYKPYFLNQPSNVNLCWGYGFFSERKGNFVNKKMSECSGEEILIELIHHLGFQKHQKEILQSAICIPCMTPFVTSHFLPRKKTDRPAVVPHSSANFAFLGQYCEIPNDIVFTVEYSVRSAQIAVYTLLGLNKKVSPIYKGTHHMGVLFKALRTMLR